MNYKVYCSQIPKNNIKIFMTISFSCKDFDDGKSTYTTCLRRFARCTCRHHSITLSGSEVVPRLSHRSSASIDWTSLSRVRTRDPTILAASVIFTVQSDAQRPSVIPILWRYGVSTWTVRYDKKGKGSPYSITERMVPELIPVLGSQPAGDVSYKPGGRLPLLSARPAVTPTTLKRAATNFAAWWTEAQWLWTACLRLLPDSVTTAIWSRAFCAWV